MRLAELDRPEQEKNFPRKIMPQIRQPDLDGGPFSYKLGNISVSNLKPVQKQRVKGLKDKAKRGFDDGSIRPIIIDKNNFIVNGHHRYDVASELDLDKVKAIRVDATIEELIKHYSSKARDEETYEDGAGGGGGAGGSGGASGGAGAGGDGGTASSSGDGGSADSGDTGSSDSAPTSDAPVARGFFGIGTMPSRKKKKKKKSFKFGGSIYETLEAAQDLNALLQGIEADLEQREKDLKKLPKKSIYEDIEPNYHFEWDEAQRYPEFKKLGKEKWIELAQKGKIVKIKDASKINNTDAGSPEEFYNLDKDKQKRALQQIARNDVEMPIIARYSDNYLELIGGNTRLTAMMLRKGYANVWIFNVPDEVAELAENFADGKVKGKSKPGRVKKAGASCKGSVSSLRAKAKKYSGERGKMYHWCANMKGGKKK